MRRAAAILLAVGALALTGCTAAPDHDEPAAPSFDIDRYDPEHPGNGLWLVPADEVIAQVTHAVRESPSVRYNGTVTELITPAEGDPHPGRTITVEYEGSADARRATLRADDVRAEVVTVDGDTYVRGNGAYAAQIGTPEVTSGWVCVRSAEALLADWTPLLDPADLVESLLTGAESIAVMEPPADAERTTIYLGTGDSPQGKLTVSAVGAPLPHDFVAGDVSGDGRFSFQDWGAEVAVAAPTPVVVTCG